jgi:uncharacterized protein (DUF736 family)
VSEQLQKIGALWRSTASESGKRYLNGSFDLQGQRYHIMVFPNQYKQEEKHPDFTITLKSVEPAPERQTPRKPDTFQEDPFA